MNNLGGPSRGPYRSIAKTRAGPRPAMDYRCNKRRADKLEQLRRAPRQKREQRKLRKQ